MKLVGDAIVGHGVDDWVAEDDLAIVGGGWVVVIHRLNVCIQQTFDFRKGIDKLGSKVLCFLIDLLYGMVALALLAELQTMGYLFGEQAEKFFHVYSDIVGTNGLVGLSLVEIVGEDDVLHQCYNMLHLFH